jgi:hypothetical protein
VFAVKAENRLFDLGEDAGVLTPVKDKARTRAGLRPSLTCVARVGLRSRRSGRRNDPRAIEQRNTEIKRNSASGRHGDLGIEGFAGLQDTEAEDQEFAHRRDDDLLGLQPPRGLQPGHQRGHGGIEAHGRQRRHVQG